MLTSVIGLGIGARHALNSDLEFLLITSTGLSLLRPEVSPSSILLLQSAYILTAFATLTISRQQFRWYPVLIVCSRCRLIIVTHSRSPSPFSPSKSPAT